MGQAAVGMNREAAQPLSHSVITTAGVKQIPYILVTPRGLFLSMPLVSIPMTQQDLSIEYLGAVLIMMMQQQGVSIPMT
jgi:hypothetical protein